MAWRIAESLETLRKQLNAMFPNRSKVSDGGIGDAAHASRSSDHNPWVKDGHIGVVTARDFTNDPKNGLASEELAQRLIHWKDPRIKYIISNRKIYSSYASGGKPAWAARPYNGANAHDHHVHVSVQPNKILYDDTRPWKLDPIPTTATGGNVA